MASALARKLNSLREKGAMKHVDIAQMLNTTPETISRWNKGKNYPHPDTERTLLELEYIVEELSDFYSPQEARVFFFSPQKLLDGKSPAELVQRGEIDEVRRFVGQIRDAVFM